MITHPVGLPASTEEDYLKGVRWIRLRGLTRGKEGSAEREEYSALSRLTREARPGPDRPPVNLCLYDEKIRKAILCINRRFW
jgi:hypothetical protein